MQGWAPQRTCAHPPRSARVWSRDLQCRAQPWRPHIDDVDRLARGEGARHRGTGCRDIPHRLNAEERPVYESAKKKGYLAVRGTGYRRGRRGNPLPNVYRQWCDARGMACVVIEQDWTGGGQDVVVVDLSTLRLTTTELAHVKARLLHLATQHSLTPIPADTRPSDAVPFNIILPDTTEQYKVSPWAEKKRKQGSGAAVDGDTWQRERWAVWDPSALLLEPGEREALAERRVAELEKQAEAAAAEVRRLKEEIGYPNNSLPVKEAVAHMKSLRADLEEAQAAVVLARQPVSARMASLYAASGLSLPSPHTNTTHAPSSTPSTHSHTETTPSHDRSATQPAVETQSQDANHEPSSSSVSRSSTDESSVGVPSVAAAVVATDSVANVAGSMSESGAVVTLSEDDENHPRMKNAIWSLPAAPVFFAAERGEAKVFAKETGALLQASVLQSATRVV